MNTLYVSGPKEDIVEFKKRARYTYEYPDETPREQFNRTTDLKEQYPNDEKDEEIERLKATLTDIMGLDKKVGAAGLKESQGDLNKERKSNREEVVFSFCSFLPNEEAPFGMDAFPGIVEEHEDIIVYGFGSRWSPPNGLVMKVSALYPSLHFRLTYFEPNWSLQGIYEVKNGETIKDEEEGFEIGICPFCNKEIGTLPGKYCPACHK